MCAAAAGSRAASPTCTPTGQSACFTFMAPGRQGAVLEQWDTLKTAASDTVLAHGGTITHHHAIRPRPPALVRHAAARTLRGRACSAGAKAALDPAGILNPGVLID